MAKIDEVFEAWWSLFGKNFDEKLKKARGIEATKKELASYAFEVGVRSAFVVDKVELEPLSIELLLQSLDLVKQVKKARGAVDDVTQEEKDEE